MHQVFSTPGPRYESRPHSANTTSNNNPVLDLLWWLPDQQLWRNGVSMDRQSCLLPGPHSASHTSPGELKAHPFCLQSPFNHLHYGLPTDTHLLHHFKIPFWTEEGLSGIKNKQGNSPQCHLHNFPTPQGKGVLGRIPPHNEIKQLSYKRQMAIHITTNQFCCHLSCKAFRMGFWKHDPSILIFKTYPFSQD